MHRLAHLPTLIETSAGSSCGPKAKGANGVSTCFMGASMMTFVRSEVVLTAWSSNARPLRTD